eukprot:2443408-Alexandrium_andersonii.AAC.1
MRAARGGRVPEGIWLHRATCPRQRVQPHRDCWTARSAQIHRAERRRFRAMHQLRGGAPFRNDPGTVAGR